ncbi:Uncharacterised protein [Vibrio cholerae]|nr:Uncharacterised protein [Vibrio cholerae]
MFGLNVVDGVQLHVPTAFPATFEMPELIRDLGAFVKLH